jgi:hypothetical protein
MIPKEGGGVYRIDCLPRSDLQNQKPKQKLKVGWKHRGRNTRWKHRGRNPGNGFLKRVF